MVENNRVVCLRSVYICDVVICGSVSVPKLVWPRGPRRDGARRMFRASLSYFPKITQGQAR